jgi:hypothetical protein
MNKRFFWTLPGVFGVGASILGTACATEPAVPPASVEPTLEHVVQKRLPCLGTNVTIKKSTTERFAQFPDGTTTPIEAAYDLENEACRAQRGALSEGLWGEIQAPGGMGKQFNVGLIYVVPLHASAAEMGQKREALRQVFQRDGVAHLQPSSESPIPFVVGSASGAELMRIARESMISAIVEDTAGSVSTDAVPQATGGAMSQADTSFTNDGYLGQDETIGVIDPGGCLVRDSHEVFKSGGVTYQAPGQSPSCTTDDQCAARCDGFTAQNPTEARCVANKCVDGHGHWVASTVAQVAPEAPPMRGQRAILNGAGGESYGNAEAT